MTKKYLTNIYSFCILQFVLIFLYVQLFCQPLTRSHVAFIGLSFVIGMVLSGMARRKYNADVELEEKQEKLQDLETTLKEIREKEKQS